MPDYATSPGFAAGGSKYCVGCAGTLHSSARTCPKCGAPQYGATGEKSRVLAVVLALVVGGLGIHKFYLGRIGWGILYILFSWTLIPVLVSFIEGLVYAFMRDETFHAKYG
ncbi:MAG: TM2 domain-containing protein [Sphingomonadales bacterium]|nr:MAG: TM2 domain-containing protein [Sphingomonadales bacterium]